MAREGRHAPKHPVKNAQGAKGQGPQPKATSASRTTGRTWLFRWLAMVGLPLCVLAAVEVSLRGLGLGFDSRFFRLYKSGPPQVWVENPDFGRRFFPKPLVRAPQALQVTVPKPIGTIRIFILGESAALGDPRPRYGAGRYLEVLLQERFPAARFEVVNTAMTAINSHAVREIAAELGRFEGDFWIVYMGNNEMVGPFGAATVFGPRAPPIWLVRSSLQLQEWRLAQLLKEATDSIRQPADRPQVWEGMAMFLDNVLAPDDPRRERVRRSFAANLEGILKAAGRAGARVVLSTVAVNLRDCPPFHAAPPALGDAADRRQFDALMEEGEQALRQSRWTDAERFFREALQLAPEHAAVHYRLGQALLGLHRTQEAREHFQRACDLDGLPFRTDGRMNELIRQAAQRFAPQVVLCDAAEELARKSPDGVPGAEFFFEHVHLNFDGNYRLARLWAEALAEQLPKHIQASATADWLSQEQCERWLGLTDWNRRSVVAEMIGRLQRPPFDRQLDAEARLAGLRGWLERLDQRIAASPSQAARAVYEEALRRRPDDAALHENYAEFLEAVGDGAAALRHRQRVCELLPHHYFSHYCLGTLLKEQRRLPEAQQALEIAARLQPDLAEVQVELGAVLAAQKQWEAARRVLVRARRLDPTDARAALFLGAVLAQLQRPAEALAAFQEAVHLNPRLVEARERLAEQLAQAGQWRAAVEQLEEAIRLAPDRWRARLNLAIAWRNLGDLPRARQQVEIVLAQDPQNGPARELQAQLQLEAGRR